MSQPRRPSAQASSLIDSLNESSDLPDPDADELLVTKELDVVIPDMTERRSEAPTKEDTTHWSEIAMSDGKKFTPSIGTSTGCMTSHGGLRIPLPSETPP